VINDDAIDAVEESDINVPINGSDHVPIELLLNLKKI
jgi:exonuclease III